MDRVDAALSLIRSSPVKKLTDRSFLLCIAIACLALYFNFTKQIDAATCLNTWMTVLLPWAGLEKIKDTVIGAAGLSPEKPAENQMTKDGEF